MIHMQNLRSAIMNRDQPRMISKKEQNWALLFTHWIIIGMWVWIRVICIFKCWWNKKNRKDAWTCVCLVWTRASAHAYRNQLCLTLSESFEEEEKCEVEFDRTANDTKMFEDFWSESDKVCCCYDFVWCSRPRARLSKLLSTIWTAGNHREQHDTRTHTHTHSVRSVPLFFIASRIFSSSRKLVELIHIRNRNMLKSIFSTTRSMKCWNLLTIFDWNCFSLTFFCCSFLKLRLSSIDCFHVTHWACDALNRLPFRLVLYVHCKCT